MKIQELPPNVFTFGNMGCEIPFKIWTDDNLLMDWLLSHNIVGYCKEPSYRHREGYIAIMVELEDFGEYWSHIPERVFSKLRINT